VHNITPQGMRPYRQVVRLNRLIHAAKSAVKEAEAANSKPIGDADVRFTYRPPIARNDTGEFLQPVKYLVCAIRSLPAPVGHPKQGTPLTTLVIARDNACAANKADPQSRE